MKIAVLGFIFLGSISAFAGYSTIADTAGNTELIIPSSGFPIIPAQGVSCYSRRMTAQEPVVDISPSYFRIPNIQFSRSDSSKDLVIAMIRVTYTLPVSSQQKTGVNECVYAGDQLNALSDEWWSKSEAVIPRGQGTRGKVFSTECSLYCGGLHTAQGSFETTANVDVYAFERDPATGDQTPVKLNQTIKIVQY